MTLTATVHNVDISLSDVDRSVYTDFTLRIARHPSESLPYLITRLLAFALEYREGLEFSRGLAEPDEPAIWAHDLTGKLTLWVEIGQPKEERIHRAAKLGSEVAIYLYKDPAPYLSQLRHANIFQAKKIRLIAFPPQLLSLLEPAIEKRLSAQISVSESSLYFQSQHLTVELPMSKFFLADI